MFSLNKRGQSTLEYSVIIAIVVASLIAMQVYMKRGIQGRFRQAADDIGDQFVPGKTTYTYTTDTDSETTEQTKGTLQGAENLVKTESESKQRQKRTGNEIGANFTDEPW